MADLNRASILGRLGDNPKLTTMASGDKCANLRLATGEKWKDKVTGEVKERTEWHSVVIFGPMAETAERYLRKGARALVEGPLRTRKWQDQSGQDRYSTEIVLTAFSGHLQILDWPDNGGGKSAAQQSSYGDMPGTTSKPGSGSGGTGSNSYTRPDLDDEIPF